MINTQVKVGTILTHEEVFLTHGEVMSFVYVLSVA
jgi:hypothetical protein